MGAQLHRHWAAFKPHLKATPARFPLAFACVLAFSLVLLLSIHDVTAFDGEEGRILWFCVIGYFLFLAVHLLAEARAWPTAPTYGVGLVLGGLLAWRIATADLDSFWSSGINLFLAPACVLAVMVAPFLKAGADDRALWQFNRVAWFAAAFALLVGLVLGGGLSSALWALDALFGLDVPDELYGDAWTLSLALLAPWLALAGMPRGFDVPAAPAVPRAIAFLATWILVPLAIAYFALLYAFMVKIAVQWTLPRGKVATLIMSYAAFGVAAHLIAHPLAETAAGHVRIFLRWFYPALLVPAGLLALAIGVRVESYGVTEDRYLVMAVAAWLLLLAPAMTLRPRLGLKAAPVSLAVLLAVGSFGPWGAESLSLKSQLGRLAGLLTEVGILQDGRIVPATAQPPSEAVAEISSIVSYLRDTGKQQALAPWFAGSDLRLGRHTYAPAIVEAMGLTFQLTAEATTSFNFHALKASTLSSVQDFDWIGRAEFYAYGGAWNDSLGDAAGGVAYQLTFAPESGRLTIAGPDRLGVTFDLAAYVKGLLEQGNNRAIDDFQLEASEGPLRVRLIFEQLSGSDEGEGPRLHQGAFLVLIGRGDG